MIKLCKELNFDLVFFDRINKASSKSDKKRIEEILNNSEYLNSRFLYYYIGNVFDEATIFVYTTKCKFFRNFGKIEVDLLTRNGEKILLDEIPFMLDRVKWRINRKKRIVIDDKNQELILKYNFIKKEYIEPLSYSFGTNPKNKRIEIPEFFEEKKQDSNFSIIQVFWYTGMRKIIERYISGVYKEKEKRKKDKILMLDIRKFVIEKIELIEEKANNEEFELLENMCDDINNFIQYMCFVKFEKYEHKGSKWPNTKYKI